LSSVATPIFARLDAHDRALFERWCIGSDAARHSRRSWKAITHAGGITGSVLAATLPALAGGEVARATRLAFVTLVVSHLVVQLVKRTVGRPRPSRGTSVAALIADPDRFSFPSGHSAAAMSVAMMYAVTFPALALPLVPAALLVGFSRVVLGVHYPGDVLIGQAIAIATGLGVLALM
jgi:undecaprenyl-diphosphatase